MFSLELTAAAALVALFNGIFVYSRTRSVAALICCLYFFLLEVLQAAQYAVAAPCGSQVNRVLSIVFFLHFAFQPVFSNILLHSLVKGNTIDRSDAMFAVRMSIVGGVFLTARFALPLFGLAAPVDSPLEPFAASRLCVSRGTRHLQLEAPMADVGYFAPAYFVHFFCMFVPPLLMSIKSFRHLLKYGSGTVFLFATGPVLSAVLSKNRNERPFIWAFVSAAQLVVIMFAHFFVFGPKFVRQPDMAPMPMMKNMKKEMMKENGRMMDNAMKKEGMTMNGDSKKNQ